MKFTLEEKLKLLCGEKDSKTYDANGKLISVTVSDGPQGLRYTYNDNGTWKEEPTSCMPDGEVLASSWNKETIRTVGEAIADDCIEHNVDVILGPGNNIKRTPLCGRNFEYFSEDPLLSGECAGAYIDGVQSRGVGTSLKHFLGNNLERDRIRMSSEMDERTIREIYGKAFEIALKHKPWTVMGSYNFLNGVRVSHNRKIIYDLLRKEYGFDGLIMSDWGAVSDRIKSVKAGLNLEMPYDEKSYNELKKAFNDGILSEKEIDECVKDIIVLSQKTAEARKNRKSLTDSVSRHKIAFNAAAEGMVLLKNEALLPLKGKNIFVTGQWADGSVISGGGSGHVNPKIKAKTLYNALNEYLPDCKIEFAGGFGPLFGEIWVDKFQDCLIKAEKADVVIICAGTNDAIEGEGHDRASLKLHSEEERCINELSAVNKNTAVVLMSGSVIDVSNWIDNVSALLYAGFAGEASTEAAAAILSGQICPSGKLAESWVRSDADLYKFDGNAFVNKYSDGVLVGYRYYQTKKIPTRFNFGFGLSYADFEYSDLILTETGENSYTLLFKVENTSDTDAKEIVQVYIGKKFSTLMRPVKELKAFDKALIKAKTKVTFSFELNREYFETFSPVYGAHYIEEGEYVIFVASDSENIRLTTSVNLKESY